MSAAPSLTVDVWSDIACPWCYIGNRTLGQAIEKHDGEVTVRYHSFELAPDTPVDYEGSEVDFLVQHKGMPTEQVQQMLGQVTATGAAAGVTFNFDTVRHTNTLRAHEALHHAAEHGRQGALLERLFRAYFTEGQHIGRDATLADLAAEVGLDRELLLADLAADRHATDVQRDLNHARQMGVRGVPFFVFEGQYGVSGAQSADTFSDVLSRVAAEVGAARA
ncbi:DsbA family oxidoreductase [Ruania albidiflava]|uniref:DsbA family oxidoreductase n=1 Tax=Ruania albidiflava TaxID=366586 RepID=UPI0003B47715|nr:DsbA family oxidoreductase [Ruania albidiflava]